MDKNILQYICPVIHVVSLFCYKKFLKLEKFNEINVEISNQNSNIFLYIN